MKSQTLIISLIHQDLKHNQLLHGLEQIGLDGSEVHFLGIMEIVAELMNVPPGKVNDDWGKMYIELMKEAINFEITSKGEALQPFANKCYEQLKTVLI